MNSFYLVGKVADEADKSQSASGMKIARFRLKVPRNSEQGPIDELYEITVFRDLAEENFRVGEIVGVCGKVSANNYEKDDVTRYNARLIGNTVSRIA